MSTQTVEEILAYLDDNVEDGGDVVYIRDDAIEHARRAINALRRADMEAVRKRIRSYVSELTSTDEEADIDGVMRCVNAAITNEEERLNA